ncbi:MAG: hypothetical protein MJ094_05195 [Saccharofermentans sp.]|nr:hypothetical protein [Saccharofermentans sp.]
MFKDKKKLYIFLAALLPMLLISVLPWIGSAKAEDYTLGDTNQYIYFDLAAGDVLVNGKDFRGSFYEIYADGTYEIKTITGNIDSPEYAGKQFYIYQSNSPASAGVFHVNPEAPEDPENQENPETPVAPDTIELRLPVYAPVTYNGQLWRDYITNNTNVEEINAAWPIDAAEFQGRKPTNHRIYVVGDGVASGDPNAATDITFVFDNLWSSYNTSAVKIDEYHTRGGYADQSPVAFNPKYGNDFTVLLKGDNRFSHFWSVTWAKNLINKNLFPATSEMSVITQKRDQNDGRLVINNYDSSNPGSITLTCLIDSLFNNTSIFGGDDKMALYIDGSWNVTSNNARNDTYYGFSNIYIDGGDVYVGVPKYKNDNWANLSGDAVRVTHALGSRNLSFITINGGTVTSISNSTAAAIGGGGGYNQAGGIGVVSITGGEVYAYNNSVQGTGVYVPSTAIGSGSCVKTNAATAVVSITGGTVFAQSNGGTAIGGGSSGNATGGSGYITISGNSYVRALTNQHGDINSVAIGGGFSGNQSGNQGGNAIISITHAPDNPDIYPTILSGSIGGGTTRGKNGINGYAEIDIDGGNICAQFVMEVGGAKDSKGNIIPCTFNMSGGTIHDVNVSGGSMNVEGLPIPIYYVHNVGGAVWMKDPNGLSEITGGSIENCTAVQGGAVYMTGGTFTMSGGSITGCSAIGNASANPPVTADGGGVCIKSASGANVQFRINGGDISGNSATNNGGGIYLENASVSILNGSISDNSAEYNGGGICVNEGTITMYGGSVDGNNALHGNGGGLYVSANNNPTLIDFLSGSFSGNYANQNGGGIAVESTTNQKIDFIMGINVIHPGTPISYDGNYLGPGHEGHANHISDQVHATCPTVSNNTAENGVGGGFYLNHVVGNGGTDNDKVNLQIYCLEESDNRASNPEANGMFMQGGIVEIFGDKGYDGQGNPACNVHLGTSILVEGGQVSVYGTMDNPHFDAPITVNIIDPANDYFHDFRFNNSPEHEYFTVSYFENFEGTGNYKQFQYEISDDTDDFTIVQNIYVHEGYQLLGWDTQPDGLGIRFEVGSSYNYLDNPEPGRDSPWRDNPDATGDRQTLTLYAIWQKIVYYIDYESNAPAGVPCSGTMESQSVTILGTNRLNPNGYSVPGYRFLGWTLNREGTGTRYSNEWLINPPFTRENGTRITLYAQWELCTHENCVLTANDNVITQTCTECGHTATASITAESVDFDGNEHPARIIYSDEWAGAHNLGITYYLAPNSEWDSRDDIDDTFIPSTVPVHAGNYTASVVIDSENSISCSYEIRRIKWPSPPSSPTINLNTDLSVTVNSTPSAGASVEYCMAEGSGSPSNWSENNSYPSLSAGSYYIFYARNMADRDHIESDSSRSEVYLYEGGNTVVLHPETGLNSDVTDMTHFTINLEDGYHYDGYSVTVTVDGEPRSDVIIQDSLTDQTHNHTIVLPADFRNHRIDIYITGAVKDCTVDSYITEGEVFTPFTNTSATISTDSAFTARFVVSDCRVGDYINQSFVFGKSLPVGTTLILRESDGSYWYYNVASPISTLPVSSFVRMGGHVDGERTVAAITDEDHFTYQLIVDFSDVADDSRLSSSLSVTLSMTPNPNDQEVPELANTTVTANLVDVASFTINPGTSTIPGNSLTASCTYTPSSGVASIWDRRNTSLVLTATDTSIVPSDLSLTIYDGQATRNYPMNENGQFIIPLGGLRTYSTLRITLNSDAFIEDKLAFNATWYVSASKSGMAPLNGYAAASAVWTFNNLGVQAPSLRINGVNNESHVYTGTTSVPVDVRYLNIPDGYSVDILLFNQQTGTYTGWSTTITDFTNNSTRVTVPVTDSGSYYISAMISRSSGGNVLSDPVRYYFIVR